MQRIGVCFGILALTWLTAGSRADDAAARQVYDNRLTPVDDGAPLLADYPEFVAPLRTGPRYVAPALIDESGADLSVRAWRFSYNARGVIEVPNRVLGRHTAVIVVHPWGIDDGQGWKTPEPGGVAFACTPLKNQLTLDHMKRVVQPLLKSLRGKVGLVAYSLPGKEDPIRKKLYRSVHGRPTAVDRVDGARELAAKLGTFTYQGQPLPDQLTVRPEKAAVDYFRQFPGLDPGPRFNGSGFWELPIPVARPLQVDAEDVVFYDGEGYGLAKEFLLRQGIRHVLLTGYNTDMCVAKTTAGYENLRRDFNTFLVGDATLATFPVAMTPQAATAAAVSFASLDLFITQVSWIRAQAPTVTQRGAGQ
jgi:hypothetical protein